MVATINNAVFMVCPFFESPHALSISIYRLSKYCVETYRRVIRFLKRACPVDYPVSVRRLRLSDRLDGDCQFKDDHFLIRINRKLVEHEAIETALHEWAHVIAWDLCSADDHCDEWGKAYSRVYRAFLKEFL